MDVEDVKDRWRILRDSYVRDWRRINKNVASGASTPKSESSFRFSKAMSFLADTMKPRPTSSEPSSSTIEPVLVSSQPVYVTNNANENSSKRKRIEDKEDKNYSEEAVRTAVVNEPAEKDEVYHFAMRLAEGLRRLPHRERAELQTEFLNKIMEVEKKLELD
ncbi:uncharacterized protein LOC112455833 [Temnothorax curvispinosus]|uniref:Uncharacterized protein LOC112455833 n=1 Tax=Temnothorax curvispinosus TaxID=300111 RepID=A0A6J1PWV8_9HYME|nr:uncharacterized protein LOC112455833 [Temnothorax curvispinosus]